MKIIALVGLPGSGKSTAARIFAEEGFQIIRFGDITEEYIKKADLSMNEKNEMAVRESLRKEHGMDVYAKLNKDRIDRALKHGNVVIDGVYSYEEYEFLRKEYDDVLLIAVDSTAEKRYERLAKREKRPLDKDDAEDRDKTEIENLNIKTTIKAASHVLHNNFSEHELKEHIEHILKKIKK